MSITINFCYPRSSKIKNRYYLEHRTLQMMKFDEELGKSKDLYWYWDKDDEFNPHPGHVVASLDKTLYDDYLCLVASNKLQIYVGRSQNVKRKAWENGQLLSGCGFVQSIAHRRFLVIGG